MKAGDICAIKLLLTLNQTIMSKKILVTGASGAFGSLICKTLTKKGHQVVGTMRSKKGKNEAIAQVQRLIVKKW